ncbi:MAG: hypothetical protein ACD_70C00203G0002 [uncultured bacterium]|nr:MAG: hypothetical protein ACD_70C00203G0002 [uncultured bacterium]OGT49363.1 MAG: hypothetical protein A3E53_07800 [Gammaproteobacteria bacterium RIFCSPHIGHO2_12_FULL_39_24]
MNLAQYQKKVPSPPHSIWTNPIHFIACGFGIGSFPFFPGTLATLAAIPFTIIMLSHLTIILYFIVCAVLFFVGVYCCGVTNRDFKTDDHPTACFDEIATFPIVMAGVPCTWYFLLIGFLLFRFFDIVKPFPICWIDQNIHGGIGVMLDDLLAAIFSLVILQGILILI